MFGGSLWWISPSWCLRVAYRKQQVIKANVHNILQLNNPFTTNKCKFFFFTMLTVSGKAMLYLKMSRLWPLALPIRKALRWRWIWNIGGMILTGENSNTARKTCHTATLFTRHLQMYWPGTKPVFSVLRGRLQNHTELFLKTYFLLTENTVRAHYKDQ